MARAIRVLYCIESMLHGGTEKQLAELITRIDRADVEPFLCTLRPSRMDLAALNVPVLELGFRSFRSPRTLAAAWQLRRFVRAHGIDVVHTFFQDPTLLAAIATTGQRVKRIVSFRDLGFWRTPAKVRQMHAAYPRFDGFLANAHAIARQIHRLDGIPLERIAVIPNGVDVVETVEAPPESGPVAVTVANLDRPVKRVDLFLSAAAIVAGALPDAKFVVVGDGPMRPELEAHAEALGIGARVEFTGSVANARDIIRGASVGVVPSDSEGLSNAILEYMAAGIPAVARDVGGNNELIVNGSTGYLVDSGEPAPIAGAMMAIMRSPSTARELGARARERARTEFSFEAMLRRHVRYYERLLAGLSADIHATTDQRVEGAPR